MAKIVGGAQQSKYDQAVARNNETINNRAAADALERGRIDRISHKQEISKVIGVQRAALAGKGVEVDSGSALDLTTDTAGTGAFELAQLEANSEREAYEFRTRGSNAAAAGERARLRARNLAVGTAIGTTRGLVNRFA